MHFDELVSRLIQDTVGRSATSGSFSEICYQYMQSSLGRFSPELALCVTIVGLLLMRLFNTDRRVNTYWIALFGSLIALAVAMLQFIQLKQVGGGGTEYFFTGLLIYDQFALFFKLFLLLFLVLVIALTVLSGIPDKEDGPDFYTLLLGATIGMMLMVSANHLLILFLGVEMTSVPSYVLVGFLKGRRRSSEAALKYVVYGAGAAGVMLYGTSLLAGLLGTGSLNEISAQLALLFRDESGSPVQALISDPVARTVALASMLVLVGLAFKLSLVPFHFWCPDVFEGASAEVAGFLSVASKAAAFALLVRFCLAFVGDEAGVMANVNLSLGIGLGVVAAVTATFGNLAAYAQTNIKRLLAYSTIAHAGYMLMAVAAMMVILNAPSAMISPSDAQAQATRCLEGLLFYLTVYLFMNLGAFAIVALIRNHIFSEEIEDYNGLAEQTPVLCVCMAICMFSLIGIPPMGGFFAKLIIFVSLFNAGWIHWSMWVILAIAGLNTVFSLFYYLRVLNAMFLTPRPDGARRAEIPVNSAYGAYVLMVSLPILFFGIVPWFMEGLSQTASNVSAVLIR
jgi:NADH-quinone oxidoreductase subunit N